MSTAKEYKSFLKRPLKVYVSTKLQNLEEGRRVAGLINATGYHKCNSGWLTAEYPSDETPEQKVVRMRQCAEQDLKDVWECDVFLLLPDPVQLEFTLGSYDEKSQDAGRLSVNRYVELGIALGLKKVVCIVGQNCPTIFRLLHFVRIYSSVEGFVSNLTPLSEKNWLFLQQTAPVSEVFLQQARQMHSHTVDVLLREIDRLQAVVDSIPKTARIGDNGVYD